MWDKFVEITEESNWDTFYKYKKERTKKLFVWVKNVQAGRYDFFIKLNWKIFCESFDNTWNNMEDFLHWLEAISIWVPQTSFILDVDMDLYEFNFHREAYDRDEFTLKQLEYYNDIKGNIILNAKIDKKQFVSAFYLAFYNFFNSDKYDKTEWETENYFEKIKRKKWLNKKDILSKLLKLTRKDLKNYLFKINESYCFYISEEDENIDAKFLSKFWLDLDEIDEIQEDQSIPEKEKIPKVYDKWDNKKKLDFLETLLSKNISNWNGMKAKDFKSEIIEKYINN